MNTGQAIAATIVIVLALTGLIPTVIKYLIKIVNDMRGIDTKVTDFTIAFHQAIATLFLMLGIVWLLAAMGTFGSSSASVSAWIAQTLHDSSSH